MRCTFDPAKDAFNRRKHGLPLSLALALDWDAALSWLDDRYDYDEWRMIALAPHDGTLYYVAYVDRADHRRIISLRLATRPEVIRYESFL